MCSARGPGTQRQPAQRAYLTCHSLPGRRHPLELVTVSRFVTLHRVRPRVPRYLGDLSCEVRSSVLRHRDRYMAVTCVCACGFECVCQCVCVCVGGGL